MKELCAVPSAKCTHTTRSGDPGKPQRALQVALLAKCHSTAMLSGGAEEQREIKKTLDNMLEEIEKFLEANGL